MSDFENAMDCLGMCAGDMMACATAPIRSDKIISFSEIEPGSHYEQFFRKAHNLVEEVFPYKEFPYGQEFVEEIRIVVSSEGYSHFDRYFNLLHGNFEDTQNHMSVGLCEGNAMRQERFDIQLDYIMYVLNKFLEVSACEEFFHTLLHYAELNVQLANNVYELGKSSHNLRALEDLCKAYLDCDFHCYDFEETILYKKLYEVFNAGGNFSSYWSDVEGYIASLVSEDETVSNRTEIIKILMSLPKKNFIGFSCIEWENLKRYLDCCWYSSYIENVEDSLFGCISFFSDYDEFMRLVGFIKGIVEYFDGEVAENFLRLFTITPNLSLEFYRILSLDKYGDMRSYASYIGRGLERQYSDRLYSYAKSLMFVIKEYLESPTVGKLPFVPFLIRDITDDAVLQYHYITEFIPKHIWEEASHPYSWDYVMREYNCSEERYQMLKHLVKNKLSHQYNLEYTEDL